MTSLESITDTGEMYSGGVGFIFIFNIIVGTGMLTMPAAFYAAGWLVSLLMVVLLAFTSYITITFMIEAMASANAMRRWNKEDPVKELVGAISLDGKTTTVTTTLIDEKLPHVRMSNYYDITENTDMGQMAYLFFNKPGIVLFNLCMIIYLYSEQAIYGVAIPKSVRNVICTYKPFQGNGSIACNQSITDDDLCWEGLPVTRLNAYRILLTATFVCLGSFVFFDVQKTKYLQMGTTVLRWAAVITMVVLACVRLGRGGGEGTPKVADVSGVPMLFGSLVFAFMCHHNLPAVTSPIRDKNKLHTLMFADYVLILGFYSLLCFTGIFAFGEVKDLYTLNFLHDDCSPGEAITNIKAIQYFLALFPVLTISTTFPITGITLRNNLKSIFLHDNSRYPFFIDRILFPLLTLIPPLVIGMITSEVGVLVGYCGSYSGTGVQYIIPACLVLVARKHTAATIPKDVTNKHASPFKHNAWVIGTLVWAGLAMVLVTVNHILKLM